MPSKDSRNENILGGVSWLFLSAILVKIIGVVYKIPLTAILGPIGKSYYSLAYNLFVPVFSVSLAGLPVAISKTVAEYSALKRYGDVKNTLRASVIITFFTGTAGTVFLLLIAKPYVISVNNHNAVYSVFVIAPTVLFCSVTSAYRGYYNGFENTKPSAISEIIEAVGKLVFGLLIAKCIIAYAEKNAVAGNNIFGLFITENTTESEIMSAVYPFAAAGSLAGVTFGSFISMMYIVIRFSKQKNRNLYNFNAEGVKYHIKELICVSLPIVAGTLIFNMLNVIDSWTVQNRLAYLVENYSSSLGEIFGCDFSGVDLKDMQNFIYGAYETAADFKNFIPSVTFVFGIGAIPVLSAGWTLKNKNLIKESVQSVIKMCMIISMPTGFVMGIMSKRILTLMYSSNSGIMKSLPISEKIMFWYGMFSFVLSVTQPLTNMLQAIGKTKITVYAVTVGAVSKVIINYVLISDVNINIYGAVIGSVVCYLLISIVELIALLYYCKIKISLKNVFIKPFLCSSASGIFAYCTYGLCEKFIFSPKISTVASIGFSAVVYVILLFSVKNIEKNDILLLPKGEKINKTLEKYGIIG